jgi:predicted dinucleotide-binding enzyme
MKIGIIGAGNIGGNLTRRLTALGHDVSVANSRGPETLKDLAAETGATPVRAEEAADGAEVVVVTVPLKAVPDLPAGLLDGAAEGVAVIDTNNYYPKQRDGRIDAIEDGDLTESRWVEQHLGHPVIKAFNGTYAQDILDRPLPAGHPDRMALPVAGDDEAAKAKVRPDRRTRLRHGRRRRHRRLLAPAAGHPGLRPSGRRGRGAGGTGPGVPAAPGGLPVLRSPPAVPRAWPSRAGRPCPRNGPRSCRGARWCTGGTATWP